MRRHSGGVLLRNASTLDDRVVHSKGNGKRPSSLYREFHGFTTHRGRIRLGLHDQAKDLHSSPLPPNLSTHITHGEIFKRLSP